MNDKNCGPYHLKSFEKIDDSNIVLKLYLEYAGWDISDKMVEAKIFSEKINEEDLRKIEGVIDKLISLELYEGKIIFSEYEHFAKDEEPEFLFSIYCLDFNYGIINKPLSEWKEQYFELREEYYKLLGKKKFELGEFKTELIDQFEHAAKRREEYNMKIEWDKRYSGFILGILSELRSSEPIGQSRKFMCLDDDEYKKIAGNT